VGRADKVVTVECAYAHSVATTLAAPGGATGPASGRGQQGGDGGVRLRALCRDHPGRAGGRDGARVWAGTTRW